MGNKPNYEAAMTEMGLLNTMVEHEFGVNIDEMDSQNQCFKISIPSTAKESPEFIAKRFKELTNEIFEKHGIPKIRVKYRIRDLNEGTEV